MNVSIVYYNYYKMNITLLSAELLESYPDSYLETLSTLSPMGEHSIETLTACLERISQQWTKIFVAVDEFSGIIGTCSILIEHKFNRGWSRVAHLEDLAVHAEHQGKSIGSKLVQQAIAYAKEQWCYKIILDADKDPSHVQYYEKFWFNNEGAYMKLAL